jgi:hypothetical protein
LFVYSAEGRVLTLLTCLHSIKYEYECNDLPQPFGIVEGDHILIVLDTLYIGDRVKGQACQLRS